MGSRRWLIGAVIIAGLVLAAGVIYAVATGDSSAGRARETQGEIVCREEDGLPGAATGKMYAIQGTEGTPIVVDGRVYGAGDYLFLGYCGPDGKLIR